MGGMSAGPEARAAPAPGESRQRRGRRWPEVATVPGCGTDLLDRAVWSFCEWAGDENCSGAPSGDAMRCWVVFFNLMKIPLC